jgi:protein phosphatase
MVADGMGGQGGGDVASQAAVDAIANYLVNVLPSAASMLETLPEDARASLHGLRGNLSQALMAGDEAIRATTNVAAPAMGTTLTMAFLAPPSLYVAHVGDSRCYVFREGRLKLLTNDHTLANKIAQISGQRPEESARLNHILWNCLGGGDEARPSPEVLRLELLPTDSVLLCTDGLTNELEEPEIIAELSQPGSSKAACERLIQAANQRGGQDNITAVLARPKSQQ